MTTEKPSVRVYLPTELHDRLKQYAEEKNILSMSKAVIAIFEDYFSKEQSIPNRLGSIGDELNAIAIKLKDPEPHNKNRTDELLGFSE